MTKQILSAIKVSILAVVLSLGFSYVYAWTAPMASPPAGNVFAPINTGVSDQTKTGDVCTTKGGTTKCLSTVSGGGGGDNLGNHSATTNLYMNNNGLLYANSIQTNPDQGYGSNQININNTGMYFYPGLYPYKYLHMPVNLMGNGTWNNYGAGKVLTSDAQGYAYWATPTAPPTGVTSITAGTGITVSPASPATGAVTVSATAVSGPTTGAVTGWCAGGSAWGTATRCAQGSMYCSAGNTPRPIIYTTTGGVAAWNNNGSNYPHGFCIKD